MCGHDFDPGEEAIGALQAKAAMDAMQWQQLGGTEPTDKQCVCNDHGGEGKHEIVIGRRGEMTRTPIGRFMSRRKVRMLHHRN